MTHFIPFYDCDDCGASKESDQLFYYCDTGIDLWLCDSCLHRRKASIMAQMAPEDIIRMEEKK